MCAFVCCKFNGLILLVSLDFKTLWKMFTQRGGVCNTSNSDKKYGGMREDASVTVQGNKAKLWDF